LCASEHVVGVGLMQFGGQARVGVIKGPAVVAFLYSDTAGRRKRNLRRL
jgi:hypothetical protein